MHDSVVTVNVVVVAVVVVVVVVVIAVIIFSIVVVAVVVVVVVRKSTKKFEFVLVLERTLILRPRSILDFRNHEIVEKLV